MVCVVALTFHTERAAAAGYTVNALTDNGGASGTAGDLRYAINQVNNSTDAGNTITFGVTGTITLSSALPALAKPVAITGPTSGAGITVDGGGNVQIFVVNSGVTASISNLTIANGNGISGGGIHNNGTLMVTNSALSDNSASYGGGIYNQNRSTLTVTNSTFSGNTTVGGFGGGIHNAVGGMLTVTNSTLSGNTASNGGSGGGISIFGGTVNLTNTIVAGNTGGDISGAVVSHGHNLIGTTSGSTGITNGDAQGDIVTAMPLLSVFGSYGGPTQTVALLPGSPAIDAGDDIVCAGTGPAGVNNKDQRGNTRSGNGAHCDIGTFESHVFTLATTNGDNQSTSINTPFDPLVVTVTATVAGEPVEGGIVTFTGPPSGAGIVPSPVVVTITGGQARITPTANGIPGGPYSVMAAVATGTTPPVVSFALLNALLTRINPASGATAGGNLVTLSGQGFGTATNTVVVLDGVALPATAIRSVTATTITYTAPAHGSGTVTVKVVIGGVTVSGSVTYTYGPEMPVPAPRSGGGTDSHPVALPGSRPGGVIGGAAPNPAPPPRP